MNKESRIKAEQLGTYIESRGESQDIWQRMESLQAEMEKVRETGGWEVESYTAECREILRVWADQRTRALENMRSIEQEIDSLADQRERRAMKLHYIDGHSWEDTAEIMHYGIDNIYRLRRSALKRMAKNNKG